MKPYEKPKLIVLSLSGNGVMCSSACTVDAKGPNMDPSLAFILESTGLTGNQHIYGGIDECQIEISGYCKFVPDGRSIVFNS